MNNDKIIELSQLHRKSFMSYSNNISTISSILISIIILVDKNHINLTDIKLLIVITSLLTISLILANFYNLRDYLMAKQNEKLLIEDSNIEKLPYPKSIKLIEIILPFTFTASMTFIAIFAIRRFYEMIIIAS